MPNIMVRRAKDAASVDPEYIAGVRTDLERYFSSVHCPAHKADVAVLATIRRGGAVQLAVQGCCSRVQDAVDFALSMYGR